MGRLSSSSDSDSDAAGERESRNHKSTRELKLEVEVDKLKKRIENLEWQLERSHKAQRVGNWEYHHLRKELEACKKQLAEKEKTLAAVCRENEDLREKLSALQVRHREAETEKWAVVKSFSERFQRLESSMHEVTQWMRKELQSQRTPIVAPLVGVSHMESTTDIQMQSLVMSTNQSERIERELVEEPNGFIPSTSTEEWVQTIPQRVTRSRSLSSRQSRFEAHAEAASSLMESLVTTEGQNELIEEELVQEPIPRRVTRSRSSRKTLNGPKADISSPQIESSATTDNQNEHIEEGLAQELIPRMVKRSRGSNLKRRSIPTMASTSAKVSSKRSRSSLIEMGHDKHAEGTSIMKKDGFYCICGQQYVNQYNLTYHIQQFGAQKMLFGCQVCGKRFVVGYKLKRHMKQVHKLDPDSGSTVSCSRCGLWFENRLLYTHHKRMQHTI
ncbi:unnamed protein product [Orchesella dallaii]|uniref:C2H2-type domain-containing protein n=1 Tax=Orchesella dallaii TaxID=48710 RepID=A0ABP1R9P6_9HEXA